MAPESEMAIPAIPDDIQQEATRIAGYYLAANISCDRLYRQIAQALLAEREAQKERDATLAEQLAAARRQLETTRGFGPETATIAANSYWCEDIAAAIRAQQEEGNG